MAKEDFVSEKDKKLERQLPGSKFGSGNTTLFQIAESKGSKLGQPVIESGATILEKDQQILANAIPANRIEQVLRSKMTQSNQKKNKLIARGLVMKHKPTGKKVTVLKTEIDTDKNGKIRHEVCVVGSSKKYKVLEESLEKI